VPGTAAATRPCSQITLGRLVYRQDKAYHNNAEQQMVFGDRRHVENVL